MDGMARLPRLLDAGWRRMSVPAGAPRPADRAAWQEVSAPLPADPDGLDHWFSRNGELPPGEELTFGGIATWSDVMIDGALVAEHRTMFRPLRTRVPPGGGDRLDIRVRALVPPRPAKRARWRNRLVATDALRSVRTSLLGRMPGSGAPIIGSYRPITLGRVPECRLRTRVEGSVGIVEVSVAGVVGGTVSACGQSAPLIVKGGRSHATIHVESPLFWWPHTHGEPHLFPVSLETGGAETPLGMAGFRTVARIDGPGFGIAVNGVPVFCRGALWSGGDLAALRMARDAGMNMVRVPGYSLYPDDTFYAACDALGLLVWQDFMFARFDYPTEPDFLAECAAETDEVVQRAGGHPCVAVFCGGDEVHQAAAMAGRPAGEWAHPLFDTVLPVAVAAHSDAAYVPNAPFGRPLPFAASAEVAHYFGVGAYGRPPAEARDVRFAAACLAFSHPPDPAACRQLGPGSAAWSAALPRDPGASWTFEDASQEACGGLFGSAAGLQRTDPERWLAYRRAGNAVLMQAALTRWRADPACGGALILTLQDNAPGPGLGLIDHVSRPKTALHAAAQVFSPVQVLLTDAGLDGVLIELVNETAADVVATVVLRGLTPGGDAEILAECERILPARSQTRLMAIELTGRFRDLTGAWKFGPAPFAAIGATLSWAAGRSEATLFPLGPALAHADAGLHAVRDGACLTVSARRFAQFVTIDDPACIPVADHFHLWPGEARSIQLHGQSSGGSVMALNAFVPAHYI